MGLKRCGARDGITDVFVNRLSPPISSSLRSRPIRPLIRPTRPCKHTRSIKTTILNIRPPPLCRSGHGEPTPISTSKELRLPPKPAPSNRFRANTSSALPSPKKPTLKLKNEQTNFWTACHTSVITFSFVSTIHWREIKEAEEEPKNLLSSHHNNF